MSHDTASTQGPQASSMTDQIVQVLHTLLRPTPQEEAESQPQRRGRGRPQILSSDHLWLAVLVAILRGSQGIASVWRLITWTGVGSFPILDLTRAAIRKRLLQANLDGLQDLLHRVSTALLPLTHHAADTSLAPFATQILALDQSTLDAVRRGCQDVREEAADSPRLLVGKIAGLFDVRRQQWVRLLFRDDVFVNEKHLVDSLLHGLQPGTLLLADLGYFCFSWFDWLTDQGFWWLSRLREKTSYTIEHIFIEQGTTLDALIWLGAYRADRTKHLIRLIQFEHQGTLYQYITNVRDPHCLSMMDAARLYARRWDIELAFKALKCSLGIRFWWSSHPLLVLHQLFGALILAQILHALHLQVAAAAGVDLFDVSLPVLATLLAQAPAQPSLPHLVEVLLRKGPRLGLIRRSRRFLPVVPVLLSPLHPAPDHLLTTRTPRIGHRSFPERSDRPIFAPRFFSFLLI